MGYGGYTIFDKNKNRFELVPGDRYSEGFVWFSNRLPRINWSIRTVFEFSLDSNLNNFGVWITSRFGPTGEVFGGPMKFVGVAILFKLSLSKLEIEVRQNDGHEEYKPIVFIPRFTTKLNYPKISLNISFSSNETLTIRFREHQKKLRKSDTHQNSLEENSNFQITNNSSLEEEDIILFNEKPIVSLSHYWLGVTSYNPKDGKPLFLKSIRIKGLKTKFESINRTTIQKNRTNLEIKSQKLLELLENKENLDANFEYQDVIEYVEALVNASNKFLRQKLLTHFIHTQTIQFTESWQRRSINAKNDLKLLREIVTDEMLLIEQEISSISYSVWNSFKKFRRELNELTDELILSYEKESKIKKKELNDIEGNTIRSFLFYFTIFEIIILIILGFLFLIY